MSVIDHNCGFKLAFISSRFLTNSDRFQCHIRSSYLFCGKVSTEDRKAGPALTRNSWICDNSGQHSSNSCIGSELHHKGYELKAFLKRLLTDYDDVMEEIEVLGKKKSDCMSIIEEYQYIAELLILAKKAISLHEEVMQ